MQLHALMFFDELVRAGSMRQAAENLGVAATAISRQIDNLEYYFSAQLVERSARGVKLTAAGELLAERAGRTMREIGHVRRLIDDLKGLQRGQVAICASGAVVANLLAPALAEFCLRFPKIQFEVTITNGRQAIEALTDATADIAVTLFAPPLARTRLRLRSQLVYDVVMVANHPLAALSEVPIAELANHPLVMPDSTYGARQAFEATFAREGLSIEPAFVTSSLEMQKELVRRGAAICLLPALTVVSECETGSLAVRPIAKGKGVKTQIDLCVAQDRQLSFAAAKLLDSIERFMREANPPRPSPQ